MARVVAFMRFERVCWWKFESDFRFRLPLSITPIYSKSTRLRWWRTISAYSIVFYIRWMRHKGHGRVPNTACGKWHHLQYSHNGIALNSRVQPWTLLIICHIHFQCLLIIFILKRALDAPFQIKTRKHEIHTWPSWIVLRMRMRRLLSSLNRTLAIFEILHFECDALTPVCARFVQNVRISPAVSAKIRI